MLPDRFPDDDGSSSYDFSIYLAKISLSLPAEKKPLLVHLQRRSHNTRQRGGFVRVA